MWHLVLCAIFSILATGWPLSAHGEESSAPKLLKTRPSGPFIEVSQYPLASGFRHAGYLPWRPTLTLAEAVKAVGGFQERNDVVIVRRVMPRISPELRFDKKRFLQDGSVQRRALRPGDRVSITFLMKGF